MDDPTADELLAFWAVHARMSDEQARQRLAEVVCVVRDEAGAIAGACSVFPADVPLIGGRRFWMFRALLPGAAAEQLRALIAETFRVLDAGFDGAPGAPVGLCVVAERGWPEAEWADPRLFLAGFLDDGRQVRLAYFDGACIAPGVPHYASDTLLSARYRILPFADQDEVSAEAIADLWVRERVLDPAEARRRTAEIQLVAIDDRDGPVGVTTAYLQRNEQLRTDAWHYRAFVAEAHRLSDVAVWLAVRGREYLEQRFVDGVDTRAPAMIYEVENPGLRAYFPQAHWLPTDFLFIGESPAGAHVRVHWFAGARAPEPAQGSA